MLPNRIILCCSGSATLIFRSLHIFKNCFFPQKQIFALILLQGKFASEIDTDLETVFTVGITCCKFEILYAFTSCQLLSEDST
jgi:hypothetical protein